MSVCAVIMTGFLLIPAFVHAQGYLRLPIDTFRELGIAAPEGDTAQEQVHSVVLKLVDYARFIVGSIATLFIVIAGIKLVFSQGNKEDYSKQIQVIVYAGLGLAIIALAGELRDIFTLEGGGFLRDPNKVLQQSRLFNRTTTIIITFIKYIAGAFCVLSLTKTGLRLVTHSSEEDELTVDKQNLFYSFLGLFLIMISDTVVNRVFFKIRDRFPGTGGVDVFPDVSEGVKLIAGTTNLLVSFVGPLAVIVLLVSGFIYVTAGGEDQRQETAKKMILYSVVGLIIIYGAYAIVSTFILGQFG